MEEISSTFPSFQLVEIVTRRFMVLNLSVSTSCLQKRAYLVASGVICIIYVLCALVVFFGVKEQKGIKQKDCFIFLFECTLVNFIKALLT